MFGKRIVIMKCILFTALFSIMIIFANINFNKMIATLDTTSELRLSIDQLTSDDLKLIQEYATNEKVNFVSINQNENSYQVSQIVSEEKEYRFLENNILIKNNIEKVNPDTLIGKNVVFSVDLLDNTINDIEKIENDRYDTYGKKIFLSEFSFLISVVLIFTVSLLSVLLIINDYNSNHKILISNFISGRKKQEILFKYLKSTILLDLILMIALSSLVIVLSSYLIYSFLVLALYISSLFALLIIMILLLWFHPYENRKKLSINLNYIIFVIKNLVFLVLILSFSLNTIAIVEGYQEIKEIKRLYSPIIDYGYVVGAPFADYTEFQKDSIELVEYTQNSQHIKTMFFQIVDYSDLDKLDVSAKTVLVDVEFLSKYYPEAEEGKIYMNQGYQNEYILDKTDSTENFEHVMLDQEIVIPNFDINSQKQSLSTSEYAFITVDDQFVFEYGNVLGGINSNIKMKIEDFEAVKKDLEELGIFDLVGGYNSYGEEIEQKIATINLKFLMCLILLVFVLTSLFYFDKVLIGIYTSINTREIIIRHLGGKRSLSIYKKLLYSNLILYALLYVLYVGLIIVLGQWQITIITNGLVILIMMFVEVIMIKSISSNILDKKINKYMKGMK